MLTMQYCIIQIYSLWCLYKPAENHKPYGQIHIKYYIIKQTIAKNSLWKSCL